MIDKLKVRSNHGRRERGVKPSRKSIHKYTRSFSDHFKPENDGLIIQRKHSFAETDNLIEGDAHVELKRIPTKLGEKSLLKIIFLLNFCGAHTNIKN